MRAKDAIERAFYHEAHAKRSPDGVPGDREYPSALPGERLK